MISIILGIIVWAVLPILLTSRIKRKSDRKAVTLICKILGAFLVLWGLYNLIFKYIPSAGIKVT